MNYSLNNLGTENFEHLVQAISRKILGEGVKIYGAGPDGQREATFEGKAPYPSSTNSWDGYWIIQAKFKSMNTKQDDFKWIENNFVSEMNGFKKKQEQGTPIPDNYLFFTNIVLTPAKDTGIKDKVDKLAEQYKELIPHIHIIGHDEICRYLDEFRDIATTYTSFILSGDILSHIYNDLQDEHKKKQAALIRYLLQSFNDDYCSRMEQAGQLTDQKVSIDKVYIDLKFKDENSNYQNQFIQHSIIAGNECYRPSFLSKEGISGSKASKENLFAGRNKYVLKGSAGQGKSTVCQFLAQIYRTYFLKTYSANYDEQIEAFYSRLKQDNIQQPLCIRIPIRIELRIYSAWIIDQKSQSQKFDLITYIASNIANKSNGEFDNETLRKYLATYSWAFFFDGLDEVPESSNRKEVMEEILKFIKIELKQADTDTLLFATTRPEGYVGEFDKNEFIHLDLLPLDYEGCINYLTKLLEAIENDSTKKKEYLDILERAIKNEQIAFMLKTPLQATIMAILVRAGGEPPRDKYSLFKEYFEIIIKREKQKSTETILNSNQELIENVYYLLGYELQKRSSTTDKSDALLTLDELKDLISKKLNNDGLTFDTPNFTNLLNDVYSMIVNRINFASEIEENKIGFSIRSIQEFLAAVYIAKNYSEKTLNELLPQLAQSSYWKNTFTFIVEYINKEKPSYLNTIIDTILSELNGNGLSYDKSTDTAVVYWGSQVAFDLLASNIFKNKPKYEYKLCRYISEYCKLYPSRELDFVSSMSENVQLEMTKFILDRNNADLPDGIFALASYLSRSETCFEKLKDFMIKYPAETVNPHFLLSGHYHKNLFSIASEAINNGIMLDCDLQLVANIILNAPDIKNDTAKQSLFKMTVNTILKNSRQAWRPEYKVINEYFGFEIELLYDLVQDIPDDEEPIEDNISIRYLIPNLTNEGYKSIINYSEKNNIPSLALILQTLYGNNIEEYKNFLTKIYDYKTEIQELYLEKLIRKNAIMRKIWLSKLYDKDENCENILNASLSNKLIHPNKIKSLSDFIIEQTDDNDLYSCLISTSGEVFELFYKTIKSIYGNTDIKKYENLMDLILFAYACQMEKAYELLNSNDNSLFNKYIIYLPEMFEYARCIKENNYWNMIVIFMYILNMPKKDYVKYCDVEFYQPKKSPDDIRDNYPLFRSYLREKIIIKLVDYINFTGNRTAIDSLFDLLFDGVSLDFLKKINWEEMIALDDKFEIINLFCKNNLEKIIATYNNEEYLLFILDMLDSVDAGPSTLPLYIHLLKYFKKRNKYFTRHLEMEISSFISSRPLDFHKYEKLEGLY